MPASVITFFGSLPEMLSVFAGQGWNEAEWLTMWTTLYWAWWISWSPFVGMFIAKISKGRSLRQFVTVVIFMPAAISVLWYVALGLIAMFLLLAGGRNALSGLQSIMMTCALPFVVILVGIMVSWGKELRNDPLMIRRRYALAAIRSGVVRGIGAHGDDFGFRIHQVPEAEGAGADFDSDDPALVAWYAENAAVDAEESGGDDEEPPPPPEPEPGAPQD